MAYFDIAGRINTKWLTTEEWATLTSISKRKGWIVPTPDEWLGIRNLLGLVDICRGFELFTTAEGIESTRLGVAQIRINQHGKNALVLHAQGQYYTAGKRLTPEQVYDLSHD
jgi:hypothetical protein